MKNHRMGQTKAARQLRAWKALQRATDTLSTLLAQEVRELNARQKTARKAADKDGPADPGSFKGLKEATAVLKDLAARGEGAERAGRRGRRARSAAWCCCRRWRKHE